MPWLKRVTVTGHWSAKDFDVDLSADDREMPHHLILTGPNGSGKSTILQCFPELLGGEPEARRGPLVVRVERPGATRWPWRSFVADRQLVAYLPAYRPSDMEQPSGPTVRRSGSIAAADRVTPKFLQYLVDLQVQARLADLEDPKEARERQAIFTWFVHFENALAELFEVSSVHLAFDRKQYDIHIELPGQPPIRFSQLAAGHGSALAVVAEIILRIDPASSGFTRDAEESAGVVVIDELSLHLHPSLQEKILPFLTTAFPRLQFVVATHSPAIICSVPDAMVVDLGSGRIVASRQLQGTPYGELMRTHFGIQTDIDLQSTKALERLEALETKPERTAEEDAELAELAERLTRTSHPLALQVWNRITARRLMAEAREGAAG